ncbi:DNA-binding response regulator [Streptomyces sp. NPDC048606]|uniref:DNA-binding response regulator n=1 Tax=Streptomyces sp. NPDC048606 TaxID=3154726 RepID=UPI0034194E51
MDEMPVTHRTSRSLRVLLVPPNPALALRLGLQPDIEVIASTLARPEVALVEEPEAVAGLLAEEPECRVLVMAGWARPGLWEEASAAGASGLVLRDGPVEELADCLRRASMGETVVDPALTGPARRTHGSPPPEIGGGLP